MVTENTLKTTSRPHDAVLPLGTNKLHGPPREKHIVIVLGVGPGLGLHIARAFAAEGYTTAILSRSKDTLDAWAVELDAVARQRRAQDGSPVPESAPPLARAFACDMLKQDTIHKAVHDIQAAWPEMLIGTCAYNGSIRKRGPFLGVTMKQMQDSVDASILSFFTFAQLTLRAMTQHGLGGSLLVTGATSSTRGGSGFVPFAASKGGLRLMCQSLAREFGEQGIHVAHIIIDGLIESKTALKYFGLPEEERFDDGLVRIRRGPVPDDSVLTIQVLIPAQMAKTWLFLAQQHPSAWTQEMDLRPAKENF
ncbi:hypothetical protein MSPP1_002312 [Malassezia sp. CBS 17886]|nr:hypothetical protein MSPP1_002312 [Malassezia sp. CBS 17886]